MKLHMKLQWTLVLLVGIFLASGCKSPTNAVSVQPSSEANVKAQPKGTPVKSGTFVKAEHTTTGTARIVKENGKQYLDLNQAFKTDNGPDLYVILYRNNQPPKSGIGERDYVSLGRLQKVNGSQRYAIPANVNPTAFKSAVIWCRQYNVTFGYAALN